MGNNNKIDVAALPAGLTKQDFMAIPEIKKETSWFTYAGIVQIATGVLNFATVGQLAQMEAQGYAVYSTVIGITAAISVIFIILGILLLVKRTTTIAYIVGAVGILFAILAIATGGSVGFGIIATILAFVGAWKVDKSWKEYQSSHPGF